MSELHKFIFDGLPVRGQLVRLTDAWRELLQRRSHAGQTWPAPVRDLMGEMTAAAVLMQANLKFDGTLILQVFGDGPVKLAVAEVQADLAFRATATVLGVALPGDAFAQLLNVHGAGRCAITLVPGATPTGRQPYQGVVALNDVHGQVLPTFGLVLEHYMRQSEQLETRLMLAADEHLAAGLLIQRLPVEGAANLGASAGNVARDDAFKRIAHLTATLTRAELLSLDANTLLRRLYWEEPLRRFDAVGSSPRFECRCSRGRVGRMMQGLGRAEIDDILAEQGRVEVACEFCALQYRFDSVDVGELFTPERDQIPPT
ncbi:MAG: Hsp33 family molecular chaperone HslO, partial [Burkholderiaceae bacterium]